jgi:hypothetical protein
MSKQIQTQVEQGKARIVEGPVTTAPAVDRSFNLPKELYIGTVAGYLGFLAIMAIAFMNPVMIIPMVIFVGFVFAGFGVPAIFTRLKGNDSKAKTWGQFDNEGIMTNTGILAPRDAAVQVLILPVLLVCWGLAAAAIAVIVS